jgi:hypothetical protein
LKDWWVDMALIKVEEIPLNKMLQYTKRTYFNENTNKYSTSLSLDANRAEMTKAFTIHKCYGKNIEMPITLSCLNLSDFRMEECNDDVTLWRDIFEPRYNPSSSIIVMPLLESNGEKLIDIINSINFWKFDKVKAEELSKRFYPNGYYANSSKKIEIDAAEIECEG